MTLRHYHTILDFVYCYTSNICKQPGSLTLSNSESEKHCGFITTAAKRSNVLINLVMQDLLSGFLSDKDFTLSSLGKKIEKTRQMLTKALLYIYSKNNK